jgi:hypothetical protein
VTANLVAGPTDFDALARLGISPGALTAPAKSGSSNSTNSSANSTTSPITKKTYGLGLAANLDISTTSGAGAAHAALGNVLAAIRNIYQALNAPPSSSSTTHQSTGPAPAYLTSQLAGYNLALNFLNNSSSSGTTA